MKLFRPIKHGLAAVAATVALTLSLMAAPLAPAGAVEIQEVKTPGGLTAWLVEDHTVPLIAMNFAFDGGSAIDPEGKEGLANVLSVMLDEGAGELTSQEFQQALEKSAVKLSFDAERDNFFGSLQTLAENQEEAFRLLKLAINEPRFDEEPLARMKAQLVNNVRSDARDPETIASRAWLKLALGDHPYARDPSGTVEGISAVSAEDLKDLRSKLFRRDGLTIAVVGAIDAETLARRLDDVFGDLEAPVVVPQLPEAQVRKGAALEVVEYDIPQSVIRFGRQGVKTSDPDYIPAFVMNAILGGGGFGSRLVEEVREKRGLTYSVYSYLMPLDKVGLFLGGAATRNDRAAETVKIIRQEIERMAKDGPTPEELADIKTYLTGSYALRFDSNAKIARQLLGLQLDEMGIDYINRRNGIIEALTIDDIKQAAKKVLENGDLLITVVGKPDNLASTAD